jgi:hypothetical protein
MDNSDSQLAPLLFSNGPASDRADKMGLYGWLIGAWTMDAERSAQAILQSTGWPAHGPDIVQLGKSGDGTDTRWSFTDITADSFLWLTEFSTDGGATWRLRAEFKCRRKA